MAPKPSANGFRKWVSPDRPWRRAALAVPVSLILHLVAAVVMRPEYKPVADYAVDLDVVEVKPGPPPTKAPPGAPAEPEPEPEPEPPAVEEPKPEPPPPPKPEPGASQSPKKTTEPKPTLVAMHKPGKGPADAGAPDSGVGAGETGALAMESVPDAGTQGSGICMHDLFDFSEPNPSWMLWLSLKSFRETALQAEIGNTLAAYSLGADISRNTGIDARKGAEGLLVTALDIFDPSSYSVVVTYDSPESAVRKKLSQTKKGAKAGQWQKSAPGYEALIKEGKQWHLGGSGRVLVVTGVPSEKKMTADAGVSPKIDLKKVAPSRNWPGQVECISSKTLEKRVLGTTPAQYWEELARVAGAYLVPDSDGHWPVALFATRDPRAVGLGPNRKNRPIRFLFATARVYFTTPARIQGEVHFKGTKKRIAAIAEHWQKIAAATSSDPFFAMAGLGRIFDKLTFTAAENKIEFTLELTEGQIRAALIFLQLQGAALERQLKE